MAATAVRVLRTMPPAESQVRLQVKRHMAPVRRRLSTLVAADRVPFRNINSRRGAPAPYIDSVATESVEEQLRLVGGEPPLACGRRSSAVAGITSAKSARAS
jgi:hypothetical protein